MSRRASDGERLPPGRRGPTARRSPTGRKAEAAGPSARSGRGRKGPRKLGVDENDTLFGRATRALGWNFSSAILGKLALTSFGILLARLLGPQEFGVAAVALVALLAVTSFNDLGVSLAIVRWPDDPAEIAPTVVTISVVTSVVIYIALFFSAPSFATALGASAATPVIRVLSLSVVTNGVVAVPAALLERYFRQDHKTIADWVHSLLSLGVSVGMAWAGYGAMSIAVGQVLGAVAGGLVIIKFAPLPLRLGFNRRKARKLVRFGMPLAGSAFIAFLVGNVDNLVAGHVLGATALGFYVLAWNLASLPVNLFSQPVRNVAPALFSRLQHDPAAMRKSFTSAATLLSAITMPICLLIAGAAVPLIHFVYGSKWTGAASALEWLGVLSAMRVLFELTYDYFVVLAKSRVVFTVQLVYLIALVPCLIVGARAQGIRGVAIAGVAVAGGVVLPWYLIELSRVGIRARVLLRRIWWPCCVAIAVGAIAKSAAKFIDNDFAACAVSGIIALVAIGLLTYRLRWAIAELRAASSLSETALPASRQEAAASHRPAMGRAVGARSRGGSHVPDPALQRAALQALIDIAIATGPVDSLNGPLHLNHAVTGPLPAYKETVRATGWEPPGRRRPDYAKGNGSAVRPTQGGLPSRYDLRGRPGYNDLGRASVTGASSRRERRPDD
ncbi:MAG TPA: lipopolysaccharide biosynthesis protein [Streptosporangiaceae bacterium]|nr:lipopolysaccharide biosynthesis protein [Streptosporangiaceae bacterium]